MTKVNGRPRTRPTLAILKAIAHPDRERMLNALSHERSPAGLARELGMPVNLVAYHMHVLAKADLVELVRTAPRRGSTEHFYRALFAITIEDAGEPEFVVRGGEAFYVTKADVRLRRRRR